MIVHIHSRQLANKQLGDMTIHENFACSIVESECRTVNAHAICLQIVPALQEMMCTYRLVIITGQKYHISHPMYVTYMLQASFNNFRTNKCSKCLMKE